MASHNNSSKQPGSFLSSDARLTASLAEYDLQEKHDGPEPLIPKRLAYTYRPEVMYGHYSTLLNIAKKHRMGFKTINGPLDLKPTDYQTGNLVSLICTLYAKQHGEEECERAVKACLPVIEHNVAYMAHSVFVTIVGAIVARALEQASFDARTEEPVLDLLADRHYIKNIITHNSSKTSSLETAAFSGLMAYVMDKNDTCPELDTPFEKLHVTPTAMAAHGYPHHYKHNAYHPEHHSDKLLPAPAVIEAVVDRLAGTLQNYNLHHNVESWLAHVNQMQFPKEANRTLVRRTFGALKKYITSADYNALIELRRSVHLLMGQSVTWDLQELAPGLASHLEAIQVPKKSSLLKEREL